MTMTTTDVTTITPLAHQEAMRLQAYELDRTLSCCGPWMSVIT